MTPFPMTTAEIRAAIARECRSERAREVVLASHLGIAQIVGPAVSLWPPLSCLEMCGDVELYEDVDRAGIDAATRHGFRFQIMRLPDETVQRIALERASELPRRGVG